MIPSTDEPARSRRHMDDNAALAAHRSSGVARQPSGASSRGMEKGSIDRPSEHVRRARRGSSRNMSGGSGHSRGDAPSSHNHNVSLEASSYHASTTRGGASSTASGATSARGTGRRGPSRAHRSSDNMESGLGATTMHGSSSVSRIRSNASKSSRTLDSHLSSSQHGAASARHRHHSKSSETASHMATVEAKRAPIQRAMSSDNVKCPEEYAASQTTRRGRRRQPAVVEEEEVEEEDATTTSHHDEDHDDVCSTSSDESGSSFGGEESDAEEGSSVHQPSKSSVQSSSSNGSGSTKHHSTAHASRASPKPSPRPASTNLLELMRHDQTVQLHDLQDKQNRRVLHFLLYQHKLGVDMAQLQQDIHDDIATNGVEQALSRPPLPLYVEPAN